MRISDWSSDVSSSDLPKLESPDRRYPDGYDEPSAPADDRGHGGPQSVAGDAAILPARGGEVQSVFRALAGPAGSGGRAGVPGPPGVDRDLVAGAEPDGVRAEARQAGDEWVSRCEFGVAR